MNDSALPSEVRTLYHARMREEETPSAEQQAEQQAMNSHLPSRLKLILAPISSNLVGYNLRVFLNTRPGRMEKKLVTEATKTATAVMEQERRAGKSEGDAIQAGLREAARRNVILSGHHLTSGKRPVDAEFTPDGIHPSEYPGIKGKGAPLKRQRDGMDTHAAHEWAIKYLEEAHDTNDFQALTPDDQTLVMQAISPDHVRLFERHLRRGPSGAPLYKYTKEGLFSAEFKPDYADRYNELEVLYDSLHPAVMQAEPVSRGDALIVETLKLFKQLRENLQVLELLTTMWFSQKEEDFGLPQVCEQVITNYLEASMVKPETVLVPARLGERVRAPVELGGRDRYGDFYIQLDSEGRQLTGFRLRRHDIRRLERGPFIDPDTVSSSHKATEYLDLQYEKYKSPESVMLETQTYVNFADIMRSDTSNHPTPPDLIMIQGYHDACIQTVALWTQLHTIVTAPDFPRFELGLNNLRLTMEQMFGGAASVTMFRVWALYIILGIVINIQYEVGLIEKNKIEFGQAQLAGLVFNNEELRQAFARYQS